MLRSLPQAWTGSGDGWGEQESLPKGWKMEETVPYGWKATNQQAVEDQATDYRKKAIVEIDALEDATEDPSIDILGTIPSTMKLSTMMTGKSPIITLKKLLSPKTTWTASMSSLISTRSWRLRMTG